MIQLKTFDDILDLDVTIGEYPSMSLIEEIHASREYYWRCYSTLEGADVDSIARRFLSEHARISNAELPYIFVKADAPIAVFRAYPEKDKEIKGALYANGALMRTVIEDEIERYIFIEDETASKWNYPSDGYVLPS